MLSFPGYNLYRRDRCSTSLPWNNLGGGGVAILIKNTIIARRLKDLESTTVEKVAVEISLRKEKLTVMGIYRPPRQPIKDLTENLDNLSSYFQLNTCIVSGDFNCRHSEWNSSDQTDANGRSAEECFCRHGLVPVNTNCGTRPNDNSNPLLDLILVNNPTVSGSFKVLPPLSDHCPVVTQFDFKKPPVKKREKWVRKFDMLQLRQILTQEPILEKIQGDVPIDFAWQAWETHFHECVLCCTYWKKIQIRHNACPWYSSHLRRLRRRQDRLYKQQSKHPTASARAAYYFSRNLYRSQLRSAKSKYFSKQASSLKNYRKGGFRWWKKMKALCNLTQSREKIPDLVVSTTSAKTDSEKADLLAEHFASHSIPSQNDVLTAPLEVHDCVPSLFALPQISVEDVHHALTHIDPNKATSDSVILPILKSLSDLLCESLSYLYNRSITTCCFPSTWKTATVTPISKKKGDSSNPNNYRPISLLSAVSRIFEDHLSSNLKSYVIDNKLISEHQFAYVPHKSTTDQLILLTHQIASLNDRKLKYDCIFLDFKKAFDTVHHPSLLLALSRFSEGATLDWFKSYLSGRSIRVKVGDSVSRCQTLHGGVPQGSHLAPILFLIFINTLPDQILYSRVYIYADDVVLLYTHDPLLTWSENIARLDEDLKSCQEWACKVHGEFSVSKTKVLSNYELPLPSSISMNGQDLQVSALIAHLGVTFSGDLLFTTHYAAIHKLFKQRVNLLCFMSKRLPCNAVMLLYKSYVRPTIEYAVSVWCFRLPAALLSKLDVLQARICRRYLRSMKVVFDIHETKESLNMKCNLQSLKYRRQFLSIVILFKYIHFHPDYLQRFNLAISKSARRPNKLVINCHGTQMSSLFLLKAAKLWNCLPPSTTSLDNLVAFKKQYLIHTYKYRFDCRGIPTS